MELAKRIAVLQCRCGMLAAKLQQIRRTQQEVAARMASLDAVVSGLFLKSQRLGLRLEELGEALETMEMPRDDSDLGRR